MTARRLPDETVYEQLREGMSSGMVDTALVVERAQRALTLALVCARDRCYLEAEIHADFGRAAVAWLRGEQLSELGLMKGRIRD